MRVHAGAQACKTKWQENQKDLKKLEECKKLGISYVVTPAETDRLTNAVAAALA